MTSEDLGNQANKEIAHGICQCLVDETLGVRMLYKMRVDSKFRLDVISVMV